MVQILQGFFGDEGWMQYQLLKKGSDSICFALISASRLSRSRRPFGNRGAASTEYANLVAMMSVALIAVFGILQNPAGERGRGSQQSEWQDPHELLDQETPLEEVLEALRGGGSDGTDRIPSKNVPEAGTQTVSGGEPGQDPIDEMAADGDRPEFPPIGNPPVLPPPGPPGPQAPPGPVYY
ncbi:MAG: hypothetical protein KDD66_10585 [Bdellovibrionales bacterium]|nr:hypothetical protein [Bdellovibrionales bacterium]